MSNTLTQVKRSETHGALQLTLLTVPKPTHTELKTSAAHVRFRLSATTRKRGLAHVAAIRRQLAASQTELATNRNNPLAPGPRRAA